MQMQEHLGIADFCLCDGLILAKKILLKLISLASQPAILSTDGAGKNKLLLFQND